MGHSVTVTRARTASAPSGPAVGQRLRAHVDLPEDVHVVQALAGLRPAGEVHRLARLEAQSVHDRRGPRALGAFDHDVLQSLLAARDHGNRQGGGLSGEKATDGETPRCCSPSRDTSSRSGAARVDAASRVGLPLERLHGRRDAAAQLVAHAVDGHPATRGERPLLHRRTAARRVRPPPPGARA